MRVTPTLEPVLRRAVLDPLGASQSWSWHGYSNSWLYISGQKVLVVSGGAHWGGGLVISAGDLARVGQLHLDRGTHEHQQVVSRAWMDRMWPSCDVKRDYGYL